MLPVGYAYTYGRKDESGVTIPLCHCDCHLGWEDNRKARRRPDAVQSKLCASCLDEAFMPWTRVLDSIAR